MHGNPLSWVQTDKTKHINNINERAYNKNSEGKDKKKESEIESHKSNFCVRGWGWD